MAGGQCEHTIPGGIIKRFVIRMILVNPHRLGQVAAAGTGGSVTVTVAEN